MSRRILPIALLLALNGALSAQNVAVRSAVASRDVIVNESIIYAIYVDVTIRQRGGFPTVPRPQPPRGDGYEIEFFERRNGSNRSSSIGFGARTRVESTQSFEFYFKVKPKRVGSVRLPAFQYEMLNRKYSVKSVDLRVSAEAPGNRYVSVSVSARPASPYVNQAVTLRYELTARKLIVNRRGRGDAAKIDIPWAATPNGFFADSLELSQAKDARNRFRVALNGKLFDMRQELRNPDDPNERTYVLERRIYPLAPGRAELGGTTARFTVATKVRRTRGFLGNNQLEVVESAKAVVSSDPVVLDVRDAPLAGRPASYYGVTGDFEVAMKLSSGKIRAGDGVTLTLTIRGYGGVESLEPPSELKGFEDFDVYKPDQTVEDEGRGIKKMTFSWFIVPERRDLVEVPKWEYSWFRPQAERFETVSVGPEPLVITGEVEDSKIFESSLTPREAVEIRTLSEGIRPIKESPGTLGAKGGGVARPIFFALAIVPLASLVLLSVGLRRRRKLTGDESLVRRRRASKEATSRLSEARALLGATRGFHGKLARSLAGLIGDKLGVPAASVSAVTCPDLLRSARVPDDLIERVRVLFDELDAKEFSAGDEGEAGQRADLARVEETIQVLDKAIKK